MEYFRLGFVFYLHFIDLNFKNNFITIDSKKSQVFFFNWLAFYKKAKRHL